MSATNDRVTNPGFLTSASKKSAPMDVKHMRKTEEGKVSVLDVVAQMKNCTQNYVAHRYKRLVEEERVPDCEMRSIARTAPQGRRRKTRPSIRHSCCLSSRDYTNHLAATWCQRISQKLCQCLCQVLRQGYVTCGRNQPE